MKAFFEIISKKDWEEKYSPEITHINQEKYAPSEKMLKSLFAKMNGGKYSDTIVLDFKTKKPLELSHLDKIIINILRDLGYELTTKESYMAGKAIKDGKEIKILDVLNGFNSKIKTKKQMENVYNTTKNENIKKQLSAIYNLDNNFLIKDEKIDLGSLSIYKANEEDKYKIVLTMDPRAIASQSTEVGWRSCMNLDTGMYRNKVKTGIEQGVFIAYLTKAGDEMELKNPTARVLIKPFKRGRSVAWKVDKIYGTAPEAFQNTVQDIVDKYSSKVPGVYKLSDDIYADDLPTKLVHGGNPESLIKLYKTNFKKFMEIMNNNSEEFEKIEKHFTPEQKIDLMKYNPSIALGIRTFDHNKKLIHAVIHTKASAMRFIPAEDFKLIDKDSWEFFLNNASNIVPQHLNKDQMTAIPEDILDKLVKKNSYNIKHLLPEQQTPERQLMAMEEGKRWALLEYIHNPTKDAQEEAVHYQPQAIKYIKDPDYDIQSIAVSLDTKAAQYIKKLHPELQLYLIKKNPYYLSLFAKQATPEAVALQHEMVKDLSDEEKRRLIGRL